MVATGELKQFINLDKLVGVEGFQYDPKGYGCAYLKDGATYGKISIFSSGRMISVGTKSLDDAKLDLYYATKRLRKLRLIAHPTILVKLRNIVATGEVGGFVDIEKLGSKMPNVLYEPSQFPGAIYRPDELEGASILVFSSGKVVLAGLGRCELLESAEKVLLKLAQPDYLPA